MKKTVFFVFAFFTAAYILSGCNKGVSKDSESITKPESVLIVADSLIDISPDSSLVLCRQFFDAYSNNTDSLYTRAKLIEGNAYFSIGDMDEAIKSMAKARELARQISDENLLINATTDLGVAMRVSQHTDSALTLYKEALSMIEEGKYKSEKAHLLTSIAILYANTGQLDEALDYANRAVIAANDCGDMDMVMYATSQAGAIYNLSGDRNKGFSLTRQAMHNAQKMHLPRYEIKALGHLIDMHLKEGNRDSVVYYLKRGEYLSAQFPENSVEGLGFLEEKYVVLAALGRNRESLNVQRHLLNVQNKAATFMPSEKLWLRMARNYSALHNYDSTAFCYERALELTDSIRQAETDKALSEFYARFKTTEKELALTHLEIENAKANMWLVVWMAIAAIVAILCVLYVRNRKKTECVRMLQSRIDGIEQERSRLAKELHDGMCNDLYGIELLLQSGTPTDELVKDVEKVRSDVRRISHQLMPPSLKDVDLPRALEDMIGKLRHAYPNITFNLLSTPDRGWNNVSENVTYSLYRICQELIGNMLRHAQPSCISLAIALDDDAVKVELSHNGTIKANGSTNVGIGIESVKERLAAIGATAQGLPFAPTITITSRIL